MSASSKKHLFHPKASSSTRHEHIEVSKALFLNYKYACQVPNYTIYGDQENGTTKGMLCSLMKKIRNQQNVQ
jgi:hypothetical protein